MLQEPQNYHENDELAERLEIFRQINEAIADKKAENSLLFYRPYEKQRQFHATNHRERLLIAANQVGKTLCAGNEFAFHVTGLYPDWWKGHRFDRPIIAWACGVSLEGVRDGLQKILLGQVGKWGTGTIPANRILDVKKKINESVDFLRVRHGRLDGTKESFVSIKSYDQGREKFQAASVDLIWCDEEPPPDVYSECLTRTNATKGKVMMTFTPLKGWSEVVNRFLTENNPNRYWVNMTIDDAEHFSEDEKKVIIDSYQPHEREARTKGIPSSGTGTIFPIEDEAITVGDFTNIPRWWKHNAAMDFGWEHPFAAAHLVYDPDNDIIYVIRGYRIKHRTPIEHVMALKDWGPLVWQWPHDGLGTEKSKGEELIKQYTKAGLVCFPKHATNKGGGLSVEEGVFDMLQRMQTGRFKVFYSVRDFFEEKRLYRRENNKIVPLNDDLISATRYGVMTIRRAKTADVLFQRVSPRALLTAKPRYADGAAYN